ncbi:MAG: hypothetical protein ACLR17_00350 [Enterobacteriaceae bacterium]
MARQLGLDRQMIGLMARALLRKHDLSVIAGLRRWLAVRNEAPQRIMPGITLTSRDENNAVIARHLRHY